MKKLNVFILLFISVNIYAQKVDNKIRIDSVSLLISQERDSLLAKILTNDTLKITKIFNSLSKSNRFDDRYLTLYPIEKWLLNYYLGDYDDILQNIQMHDSAYYQSLKLKIYPLFDYLVANLITISKDKMTNIFYKIDNTLFSEEDKDFLKLLYRYCLFERESAVYYQDTINLYSDRFLQQNVNSKFLPFIEDNMKRKILPSNIAIAFDFAIGVGNYTKSFLNSFGQNGFTALGIEIDYSKFNFNYRFSGGSSRVNKSFIVGKTLWLKDIHPDVTIHEFSLGCNILDCRFLRITPFCGISSLKLKPSDSDIQDFPELDISKITMSTYTLGITTDFKYRLHKFDKFYGSHNNNFGFVRIRYGYNYPSNDYDGNVGYMNYLTIGWGLIFRGVKLEK